MSYLIVNGYDLSNFVKSLKIGYETLVSDNSGRNANGDTVIDVINTKVKLYVTFRPMDAGEMKFVLDSINDFVVSVTYRDAKTNTEKTINCYTSTPEPDYYFINRYRVLYKEMNLNFIQL